MPMDMTSLGAMGVGAALCAVVLREKSPQIALVLSLATCVLILCALLPSLEEVETTMEKLGEMGNVSSEIFSPVVKTVGIAIVTKLSAELCRDAKENGIASFVELCGSVTALLLAIPLLNMVLELIGGLL